MRATRCPDRPRWHGLESLEPRQLLAFIVWDGGGGDQSWDNPLNWAGDALPGPSDIALINAPGQQTVRLTDNADRTVAAIWSLDALDMAAGSLTVTTQWRQSAPLSFSGGRIDGAADLLLNGDMSWTGGELRGAGALKVLPGGTLTIAGGVTLARPLVNAGAVVWASGDLAADGARITNLADATFTMQSGGTILAAGAPSALVNLGTVVRDGAPGDASRVDIAFNNFSGRYWGILLQGFPPPPIIGAATVEVRTGTLQLAGAVQGLAGGQWNTGVLIVRDAGALLIPGGPLSALYGDLTLDGPGASFPQGQAAISMSSLTLSGGHAFDLPNLTGLSHLILHSAATVTGVNIGTVDVHAGTLTFRGRGELWGVSVDAGATLVLQNADISAGTITGDGEVRVVGAVHWRSGTIEGAGSMVIGPGATLHISADPYIIYYRFPSFWEFSPKTLNRRTVNFGDVLWDDAQNQLYLGADLVNRGTFTIDRDGSIYSSAALEGRHVALINFGTLTSAQRLILRGAGGGVELSNRAGGTVRVASGELRLYGGESGAGAWIVDQGAALIFGGLAGALTGGTIFGGGEVRVANSLTLDSAAISGGGDLNVLATGRIAVRGTGMQTIQRARVTSAGTVEVGPAAGLVIDGQLVNNGTIDLGDRSLRITGDFTSSEASTLRLLRHEFVFVEPQVEVLGVANAAGSLVLSADWPAITGYQWRFMRAAAHSGAFGPAAGGGQIAGRTWAVQWVGQEVWATLI